ncbi:HAD family hydrolase [Paenibacillus sp. J2TS4]|uniref:HAD family hydrolase n=1 Tax=Paenibacillus sp. J2TS4 TaxID=2807194 RepID=UPI001B1A361B|nr:HAD family hydrolase [Paenibacillus sp. J2TS4]GIP35706.1 haloacid dehalogenase [Paenibacillus sp. J2TS4]
MTEIKLIVSDLDGTLLSAEHQLTEEVRNAVSRFTRAGGMFTVATGRPGLTVRSIVDELEIEHPFILCNGSVIADRYRTLEMAELKLHDLIPAMEEADGKGVSVLLFEEERISVFRKTFNVEKFEHKENISCDLIDFSSDEWKKARFQKVLWIGDYQIMRPIWDAHLPRFGQRYGALQSEEDYLEIIPHNQSKGQALKKLMSRLRLDRSQVMAIGNQLNDLDMIENAGIGVAVANSHPLLKEKADYVCSRGYGDGVVEVIEAFCSPYSGEKKAGMGL